jgi:hypothetical protein
LWLFAVKKIFNSIIDVCPTNDRQRIKENPEKQGNIPLDNAITKANVNK